jgi:autotransporter-associated beta strand protein
VGGTTGTTTGTFTQNGGTVVAGDGIIVGFNPGNSGTLNLNGGTLSAGRIQVGGSTPGTGSLNFNGGKVIATSSNPGFISGFTLAGTSTPGVTINAGGATIDTNGNSPTVVSPLVGVGAFTKQGAGTLTLNGVNTYSGGTVVSAGTLVAGSLGTGNVELAGGATLTLNLATALGDISLVTLDGPAAVMNLNFTGADTIGMLLVDGTFVAAGTYTADQLNALYAGQFSGTGSLTVTAVPEPSTVLLIGLGFGSVFLLRRRAQACRVMSRSI